MIYNVLLFKYKFVLSFAILPDSVSKARKIIMRVKQFECKDITRNATTAAARLFHFNPFIPVSVRTLKQSKFV